MVRNIEKAIKQGREIVSKHNGLDLNAREMMQLREMYFEEASASDPSNALYRIILKAYHAGLAVGKRNVKANKKMTGSETGRTMEVCQYDER